MNLFFMSSSIEEIFYSADFSSFTMRSSRDLTLSRSAFICSFYTRRRAAVVSESSSYPCLNFKSFFISSTICWVGSLFWRAIVFCMCSRRDAMWSWSSLISFSSYFFSTSNFSVNSLISFSFWYKISYFCSSLPAVELPRKSLSSSRKFYW